MPGPPDEVEQLAAVLMRPAPWVRRPGTGSVVTWAAPGVRVTLRTDPEDTGRDDVWTIRVVADRL
jgi:hypothetical protein